MHYIRATVVYIRATVVYIRATVVYIRATVVYIRATVVYIRVNVVYIRATVVYIRATVALPLRRAGTETIYLPPHAGSISPDEIVGLERPPAREIDAHHRNGCLIIYKVLV